MSSDVEGMVGHDGWRNYIVYPEVDLVWVGRRMKIEGTSIQTFKCWGHVFRVPLTVSSLWLRGNKVAYGTSSSDGVTGVVRWDVGRSMSVSASTNLFSISLHARGTCSSHSKVLSLCN